MDEACSIIIYQGDLETFTRNTLLYGSGLGINNSAFSEFDELYRSPQFPMLGGNCFAGLDDAGVLHIFRGQPVGIYHSMWSTSKHNAHGLFGFERYQLQLLREGELRIHEVQAAENVCVWSSASASCNDYISSASMAITKARISLRKACTLTNIRGLPGRIMNSKMVKYIRNSVALWQQKLSVNTRVMLCYLKHAFGKYIQFRGSGSGDTDNGFSSSSTSASLEECLSAARSTFTENKENERKRRPKGFQ